LFRGGHSCADDHERDPGDSDLGQQRNGGLSHRQHKFEEWDRVTGFGLQRTEWTVSSTDMDLDYP
jgi:hypothetical protein